jgi:hypothetical protein
MRGSKGSGFPEPFFIEGFRLWASAFGNLANQVRFG